MKITQVRNATIVVDYAGARFLIDPMLAEQGGFPPFPNTPNGHMRNPLVPLPVPVAEIVKVDAVIVTHTHMDHWDEAAAQLIPKDLPIFVQHEGDQAKISQDGFLDVRILTQASFAGIELIRTSGQHGSDAVTAKLKGRLGDVSGVVFRAPEEGTLYVAGDTVWNESVKASIDRYSPDVVIVNCGDAQILGAGSIIMNKEDVLEVCNAAPAALVVASHMEAVNHAVLTRAELQRFVDHAGLQGRCAIPLDGETICC